MILLKESIDRYYYIGKYVIYYLYISSIIVVFWIEILLWTLIWANNFSSVLLVLQHSNPMMKGSQSWRILHGPFSPRWLSTHIGSPSSRCGLWLPYCTGPLQFMSIFPNFWLRKCMLRQTSLSCFLQILVCDYLYLMRAVYMPNESKIHRCACVSAKANVWPKTSQCSNILFTHGNQTFLTYLTPNPQKMKRLRVWKLTQNLNRYPPAKQLKRGCSTLDMEPFWESRLKISPGGMMQMGALENDTGC